MEDDSIFISRRAVCYVCPICNGRITRVTLNSDSGLLQWRCHQCARPFGPAWRKAVWGTKPGVGLVGPELWPASKLHRLAGAVRSLISQILFLTMQVLGRML